MKRASYAQRWSFRIEWKSRVRGSLLSAASPLWWITAVDRWHRFVISDSAQSPAFFQAAIAMRISSSAPFPAITVADSGAMTSTKTSRPQREELWPLFRVRDFKTKHWRVTSGRRLLERLTAMNTFEAAGALSPVCFWGLLSSVTLLTGPVGSSTPYSRPFPCFNQGLTPESEMCHASRKKFRLSWMWTALRGRGDRVDHSGRIKWACHSELHIWSVPWVVGAWLVDDLIGYDYD